MSVIPITVIIRVFFSCTIRDSTNVATDISCTSTTSAIIITITRIRTTADTRQHGETQAIAGIVNSPFILKHLGVIIIGTTGSRFIEYPDRSK